MTPPGLRWHVTVLNAKLNVQAGRQASGSWTGNGQAQGDLASWPLPTKQGVGAGFSEAAQSGNTKSPQVAPEVLGPKISLEK